MHLPQPVSVPFFANSNLSANFNISANADTFVNPNLGSGGLPPAMHEAHIAGFIKYLAFLPQAGLVIADGNGGADTVTTPLTAKQTEMLNRVLYNRAPGGYDPTNDAPLLTALGLS